MEHYCRQLVDIGRGAIGGALYNNSANASVNFAVLDGESFKIFASDTNNSLFPTGISLLLTAGFSDGTTATTTAIVP